MLKFKYGHYIDKPILVHMLSVTLYIDNYCDAEHCLVNKISPVITVMTLQHILHQDESSLLQQTLRAQRVNPDKSSWASDAQRHLITLKLNLSDDDLIKMTKDQLRTTLNSAEKSAAFSYLMEKKEMLKTKGNNLTYEHKRHNPGSHVIFHQKFN